VFQEASDRIVRPGDLVSFDTDLIGPFAIAPTSRAPSSAAGAGLVRAAQALRLAMEQIHYNIDLVKPHRFRRVLAEGLAHPERLCLQPLLLRLPRRRALR